MMTFTEWKLRRQQLAESVEILGLRFSALQKEIGQKNRELAQVEHDWKQSKRALIGHCFEDPE